SVLHLADHLLVLLELFHPLTQVLRLGVGFGDLGESTVLVEGLLRGVLVTLSMRLGSRVEIVLSHFCVCAIGRGSVAESGSRLSRHNFLQVIKDAHLRHRKPRTGIGRGNLYSLWP